MTGFDADVAVVGAGPVGSATAIALARSGMRVSLLEKADRPHDKPCGEGLMPEGVACLRELGIHLPAPLFPPLRGVRYRMPGAGATLGLFRSADGAALFGAGVRRTRLAEVMDAAVGEQDLVEREAPVRLLSLSQDAEAVTAQTSRGRLRARWLIATDGLGSPTRRALGWEMAAAPPHRRGLVGHLHVNAHGIDEVVVSFMEGADIYVAPTSDDELLAVVLARADRLRGKGIEDYRRLVFAAHPEFAGAEMSAPLLSAGPFRVRPRRVADGRVFLAGDAAGFIDPLTGDGMTAGLAATAVLREVICDGDRPAARYSRWHATQWRRRSIVTGLALRLSSSQRLARRALAGTRRNPGALEAMMQVSGGSRRLDRVGVRSWLALAGY